MSLNHERIITITVPTEKLNLLSRFSGSTRFDSQVKKWDDGPVHPITYDADGYFYD